MLLAHTPPLMPRVRQERIAGISLGKAFHQRLENIDHLLE